MKWWRKDGMLKWKFKMVMCIFFSVLFWNHLVMPKQSTIITVVDLESSSYWPLLMKEILWEDKSLIVSTDICLFVCLSVCLSICPSICPSTCLFISVCLVILPPSIFKVRSHSRWPQYYDIMTLYVIYCIV